VGGVLVDVVVEEFLVADLPLCGLLEAQVADDVPVAKAFIVSTSFSDADNSFTVICVRSRCFTAISCPLSKSSPK